jgi:GTP cyclohydrolase I
MTPHNCNGCDANGTDQSLMCATRTCELKVVAKSTREHQVTISEKAIQEIIGAIPSEDSTREGLRGTPRRFANAFADLTRGYSKSVDEEVGDAIFGEKHDGMVVMKGIPVYSLCEHHLLPFFGVAHISYIPDPDVGIVGLSKFSRIVDVLAKRLQVQERLTTEIVDNLDRLLKPKGVVAILTCRHLCMEMRGVRCKGVTTTTIQKRGVFLNSATFGEFCSLLNINDQDE